MKTFALLAVLLLAGCTAADWDTPPLTPAEQARNNAMEGAVMGNMYSNMFAQPRTCMNIGGIVTCQ